MREAFREPKYWLDYKAYFPRQKANLLMYFTIFSHFFVCTHAEAMYPVYTSSQSFVHVSL